MRTDGKWKPIAWFATRKPNWSCLLSTPEACAAKEAEWGSSEALQLGDWVLSIGRSSGRAGTVSAGIVSGRTAGAQDDLLRTDAVIGSAGSGGPLVNLEGRIVGINRARLDPRGWPDGFGLAIPAEPRPPLRQRPGRIWPGEAWLSRLDDRPGRRPEP